MQLNARRPSGRVFFVDFCGICATLWHLCHLLIYWLINGTVAMAALFWKLLPGHSVHLGQRAAKRAPRLVCFISFVPLSICFFRNEAEKQREPRTRVAVFTWKDPRPWGLSNLSRLRSSFLMFYLPFLYDLISSSPYFTYSSIALKNNHSMAALL